MCKPNRIKFTICFLVFPALNLNLKTSDLPQPPNSPSPPPAEPQNPPSKPKVASSELRNLRTSLPQNPPPLPPKPNLRTSNSRTRAGTSEPTLPPQKTTATTPTSWPCRTPGPTPLAKSSLRCRSRCSRPSTASSAGPPAWVGNLTYDFIAGTNQIRNLHAAAPRNNRATTAPCPSQPIHTEGGSGCPAAKASESWLGVYYTTAETNGTITAAVTDHFTVTSEPPPQTAEPCLPFPGTIHTSASANLNLVTPTSPRPFPSSKPQNLEIPPKRRDLPPNLNLG